MKGKGLSADMGYVDYLASLPREVRKSSGLRYERTLYPEPHGKAKRLVLTEKMLKEFGLENVERVGVEVTDNGQFRVWALPVIPGMTITKRKRVKKTVDNSPGMADNGE